MQWIKPIQPRDRVHNGYLTFAIGNDHGIANAGQGNFRPH
jgi:hypothetical protein